MLENGGMSDAAGVVRRAQGTRIAVVGGSIAGLVAALEFARVGMAVTVFERSERWGGAVEEAPLTDDIIVDAGIDHWTGSTAPFTTLLEQLGLADRVFPAAAPGLAIRDAQGRTASLAEDSILGIPANPWHERARHFIGWRGAWRAYLDRLRPPLTIGHQPVLGALVRTRMGARVADRLVAPVVRGRWGVGVDEVDVTRAIPGLGAALTRTGSLAGGVAQLLPDSPVSQPHSLVGGLASLVPALLAELADLGAVMKTDAAVTGIHHTADGWSVVTAEATETADAVVVATNDTDARAVLSGAVELPEPGQAQAPSPIDVTTLLIRGAVGDVATEVLSSDGTVTLVNAGRRWPWVAAQAGSDRTVVRVTAERADPADPADTDAVISRATAFVTGLEGYRTAKVDAALTRTLTRSIPAVALGQPDATAAVRRAIAGKTGLAVVGSWLVGDDLADVVADTIVQADGIRSRALWAAGNAPSSDPV